MESRVPLKSIVLRSIACYYGPIVALLLAIFSLSWLLDAHLGAVAVFLPISIAAGLWLIAQGLKDRADHHAIERHIGREEPGPGDWVAICGKTIALQPDAEAPFDDVLAFRYQVFDEETRPRTQGSPRSRRLICSYDGFYLVPTGIETTRGSVRLCGFPDLSHLDKRSLPAGVHDRAHARAQKNPRILPRFLARSLFLASIVDRFEGYIRYGEGPEGVAGKCQSWLLRPMDEVCVFGRWQNDGLWPGPNRPRGLPVYSGTARDVRERLKDDSKAFFIIGGVAIGGALIWAAWMAL